MALLWLACSYFMTSLYLYIQLTLKYGTTEHADKGTPHKVKSSPNHPQLQTSSELQWGANCCNIQPQTRAWSALQSIMGLSLCLVGTNKVQALGYDIVPRFMLFRLHTAKIYPFQNIKPSGCSWTLSPGGAEYLSTQNETWVQWVTIVKNREWHSNQIC